MRPPCSFQLARLLTQLKSKEAAALTMMQDTAKATQRERMLKVWKGRGETPIQRKHYICRPLSPAPLPLDLLSPESVATLDQRLTVASFRRMRCSSGLSVLMP